jgi:hypothetical protein
MNQNLRIVYLSILAFVVGGTAFVLYLFFVKDKEPKTPLDVTKLAPIEQVATDKKIKKVQRKSKPKEKPRVRNIEGIPEPELDEREKQFDMAAMIVAEALTEENVEGKETTVYMDIGRYDIDSGDEFEVNITVAAPELANFSLMMEFDPKYLDYVADSAIAVGKTFRYGIDFYAQNDKGSMILISKGDPGAKHTEKVIDKTVAKFRMKARKPGITMLVSASRGMILWDTFGNEMEYDIQGGEIEIR